jgi:Type II intron maturase
MPSRDPADPPVRRFGYVRYAEDTLLGFSGPRAEAEMIKGQRTTFLPDTLKLALSQDKTLITHARSHAARFLGSDVVTRNADDQHDHRGQRCSNGALGRKVPVDGIKAKWAQDRQRGQPIPLAARLNDTDYSIVSQDQAEYRGFVQYYLRALNVHRLWRLHHVRALSLASTLANKHKSKLARVYRKYQTTVTTPHGTPPVLEVRVPRGADQPPLVARCGGMELRWHKTAILNDRPKEGYSRRSEIAQRLLAQRCELCGAEEDCAVHPLRKLVDLHKAGRQAKPAWVKRRAMRQRKTLGVCRLCHAAIHYGEPKRHKSVA